MASTSIAVTTDGPWHGAVPPGWTLKQLKWAVTFQRGHDLPTEDRNAGTVPVVAGGGITGWHDVAQARGPGIVTGRYGTVGEFHLIEQDYWPLNTSLYSIDLHGNHAGFLRYMLEPLAPLFHLNAAKSAVPGIDRSDIHTIPVAVPPPRTQHAIADYLDRETARLDALVAAKERVLGLLAEKRRALITRAVTRGLDPRAPLRDSGIPWLGKIPAHWELVALRFLVDTFGGATPSTGKPELWDGDIPWVSPKDMKREEIADAEDHVSLEALEGSALRLIDPVAVLVVVRGMILAHSFPPATTNRQVTINQDMKALRCRASLDPHFLRNFFWGLESHLVSLVDSAAHGTRKLGTETLGRFEVCVPPMAEQRAIVEYIANSTARLDRLRVATERTISLLKERRVALIAAAVTGQIDVGAAA